MNPRNWGEWNEYDFTVVSGSFSKNGETYIFLLRITNENDIQICGWHKSYDGKFLNISVGEA